MKKAFNLVIVDDQDFWNQRTDYIGTANSLDEAKTLLRDWVLFMFDYEEVIDFFKDGKPFSIEIWETEINSAIILPSDVERIEVSPKEVLNY